MPVNAIPKMTDVSHVNDKCAGSQGKFIAGTLSFYL